MTSFFHKIGNALARINPFRILSPIEHANKEIMTIIEATNTSPYFDENDKKIIAQVVRFRERIAREIMVPRVDIFSLSAETPIQEAARLLGEEGYSRVPVYRDSMDEIVGVLMYKDVLQRYMAFAEEGDEEILQAPIDSIMKGVLHVPETKKIAVLLQEFRRKQTHLAIVVDEYGATEGLVTIEDILEEIVGEIEDEYDVDESLFVKLPKGGWVIDGRMSILDIEEQMGIEIPQDGDYDTLGGFLFYRTGMIPPKGHTVIEEGFTLEVLRSDERRVEKVCLKPVASDPPPSSP